MSNTKITEGEISADAFHKLAMLQGACLAALVFGHRLKNYPSVSCWDTAPSAEHEQYRQGYVRGFALMAGRMMNSGKYKIIGRVNK